MKLGLKKSLLLILVFSSSCLHAGSINIQAMTIPELCTYERIVRQNHAVSKKDRDIYKNELASRREDCRPSGFYDTTAGALITYSEILSSQDKTVVRPSYDPYSPKADFEQRSEITTLTVAQKCTIKAFTEEAGISANGLTLPFVIESLNSSGQSCHPKEFYQAIAIGLISKMQPSANPQPNTDPQISEPDKSDHPNVARRKNNKVNNPDRGKKVIDFLGSVLGVYLQSRYGKSDYVASDSKNNSDASCWTDAQCKLGQSCIKPEYKTRGICVTKVDSFGQPVDDSTNYDITDPNTDDLIRCTFDIECPTKYRCDESLKVCLK